MTTTKEGKIWFSIRLYYCFIIDLVMHFFLANLIGRSWRTWKKNWIRHTYLTQVCFKLILYHICKLLPITIWLWKISHNKRAVWLVMRIIRLGMTILHFLELRSYDQQSLHIKDTHFQWNFSYWHTRPKDLWNVSFLSGKTETFFPSVFLHRSKLFVYKIEFIFFVNVILNSQKPSHSYNTSTIKPLPSETSILICWNFGDALCSKARTKSDGW